jgi:lipopolysaccharide/colanic/teichoic acid biosynthesis glycosyltransferase
MPIEELPKWYSIAKRSMDIFVGIVGLAIVSPLFLFVPIFIKTDSSGSVFFNQERVGKNRKSFRIHKFRTMVKDAEKNGPSWSPDPERDPRVTLVGKFLRKSKIDEFPQFFNLIKGEMTLVGPRPERPPFVNCFIRNIPGYGRRLEVTPGITGLAQLRTGYDRNAMDVINKLMLDVDYIKNRSLSMDLKILAETSISVLMGKF